MVIALNCTVSSDATASSSGAMVTIQTGMVVVGGLEVVVVVVTSQASVDSLQSVPPGQGSPVDEQSSAASQNSSPLQ